MRRVLHLDLSRRLALRRHSLGWRRSASTTWTFAGRCFAMDRRSPSSSYRYRARRDRPLGTWSSGSPPSSRQLTAAGVQAPPGFAYLGHSIRSMAASAMAAIGVPRHVYIFVGGWARGSTVVDKHYIDPTFRPSPAAHALYGWLLASAFSASAGTVEAGEPLPDPWLEAAA